MSESTTKKCSCGKPLVIGWPECSGCMMQLWHRQPRRMDEEKSRMQAETDEEREERDAVRIKFFAQGQPEKL